MAIGAVFAQGFAVRPGHDDQGVGQLAARPQQIEQRADLFVDEGTLLSIRSARPERRTGGREFTAKAKGTLPDMPVIVLINDASASASEIVAGEWWPEDYSGPPLISLDANLAKGFGVGLGDTLTVNVLGRPITATIKSLRDIDWRSLRFDFAIIFAPGTLEGAPHSHIAAIEAPPEAEDTIERTVADQFLNVSAIRVREALAAAAQIMEGVSWAVRGIAAITILAGTLVEVGEGRRSPESVAHALESRERSDAGITAPARGLTLKTVHFEGYPRLGKPDLSSLKSG